MPGRTQALMRTRCPACGTVFRVTSEQLRLKAGKVRCGQCQTVFNAFDQFLPEEPPPAESRPSAVELPPVLPEIAAPSVEDSPASAEIVAPHTAAEAPEPVVADGPPTAAESVADDAAAATDWPAVPPTADPSPTSAPPEPAAEADDGVVEPAAGAPEHPSLAPLAEMPGEQVPADGDTAETLEQSTQAARQAGLVAARELSDAPAYNRWAAGTLADAGSSAFAPVVARRAVWPFVVASVVLLLALSLQLLLHFRTDVVRWLPATASYYELAGLTVPLSRNPELVAIEASDLQSDNVRGLFVLQATLHNRAAYAQDWPALELTLTDAADSVVARKVMAAAEYLPPTISPELFPANGEVAVRLWIEARNLGAAGYRLYVFYP